MKQNSTHIINRNGFAVYVPVIAGTVNIFLFGCFPMLFQDNQKDTSISFYFLAFFFTWVGQIIPYLVATLIFRDMVIKELHKRDLPIVFSCMLLPPAVATAFGYYWYSTAPFALALLMPVNFVLLVAGLAVGEKLSRMRRQS